MRDDPPSSQTIRAVLGLRGLVIQGALAPGERVLEQMLVERLGVSRTPARTAMARVCEEGLLESLPAGGYVVARFSESDVFDAIAIRGSLEGMAVRRAAERGVPAAMLQHLHRCVDELDAVVERLITNPDLTEYVRLNDRIHDLLLDAAHSPMIVRSLDRLKVLPFAAPNAFVSVSSADSEAVRNILTVSQEQHRSIVEAIDLREGARAEALAVEHARSAWKYLHRVFENEGVAALRLPGMHLVQRTPSDR